MQIGDQRTTESLAALGNEATILLCAGETSLLAERFGYALAYGREVSAAITEDLERCLREIGATAPTPNPKHPSVTVRHYASNETGLLALIECVVPTDGRGKVLLELVVTGNDDAKQVSLEDISVGV